MPSWARAPAVIRRIATNKALAASPRPMAAARMAVIPWIIRRFIAAPAYGRPRGPGQPVSAPPRGWGALRGRLGRPPPAHGLVVVEVLGEHARGGGRFGPGSGRPGGLGRARGNGSSASSAVGQQPQGPLGGARPRRPRGEDRAIFGGVAPRSQR